MPGKSYSTVYFWRSWKPQRWSWCRVKGRVQQGEGRWRVWGEALAARSCPSGRAHRGICSQLLMKWWLKYIKNGSTWRQEQSKWEVVEGGEEAGQGGAKCAKAAAACPQPKFLEKVSTTNEQGNSKSCKLGWNQRLHAVMWKCRVQSLNQSKKQMRHSMLAAWAVPLSHCALNR